MATTETETRCRGQDTIGPCGCGASTPADCRARRRAAGLCPTCGNVRLTKRERANGYQCPFCTARDEGMGY